jgi:CheY-like chemotaxis protein
MTPTILVVDDELPIRELLVSLLEDAGYQVLAAPDGSHALALARAERVALVITDLMMPIMDGAELCRRLKDGGLDYEVPVVLMSAVGGQRAESAPADGFVKKPFDLDTLLDLVAAHVGLPGCLADAR